MAGAKMNRTSPKVTIMEITKGQEETKSARAATAKLEPVNDYEAVKAKIEMVNDYEAAKAKFERDNDYEAAAVRIESVEAHEATTDYAKEDNKAISPDNNEAAIRSKVPSFISLVGREILHDKFALVSFNIFVIIIAIVFVGTLFMDMAASTKVNLALINKPPSKEHLLGTDASGRDMLMQLFLGARNSFMIAIGVTILCGLIGIIVGLIAGYFGGRVDNLIMRILDFFSMLPSLMIIIVIVSMIPKYNVVTFIAVMTAFGWFGKARLVRAKTLQQSSLDYVLASKTLGTRDFVIMLREVLPNIASIIIVNLTLNLAANMGLETGLTFLGFGLPFDTPSLGTLIKYAAVPENLQRRVWLWLPAALLIIVMMLCINFVGQAVKRAADSKQRIK